MPNEVEAGRETEMLEAITRRLDAIISLLVEHDLGTDKPRQAYDQSVRLAKAGLRPAEIATITGRHPNNISRDLSKARKQGDLPKSVRFARA